MPGRRTPPARRQRRDLRVVGDGPGRNIPIEPIGAGDWIRMMMYSHPGWGKTSIWGTAALTGRTLIIRSSMDLMPARILQIPGLEQVTCDTHEQMDDMLDYCRMTENFPYLWVIWDNISTAQDVLLDDVWEAVIAEKPQRHWLLDENGRKIKPNLTPSSGLDRGEYGRNAERIQRWVRHMVGCRRFHFGIGAHPADLVFDEQHGEIMAPWIQVKNMSSKICGYCNMVTYLELMENGDEKWRRLHFAEDTRFYAKDQYDAFLPDGFLDVTERSGPTIPRIMAAVERARSKPLGGEYTTTEAVPERRGRRGRS